VTGPLIPTALGPPREAKTYVVVTIFRGGKTPVIHTFGPYRSRSRAKGAIGRMRHADQTQHAEYAELISYHVRLLAPDSPLSPRAGRHGAP
jgi:hypothetical protein